MVTIRIGDTQSITKKRRVNTSAGSYLVRELSENKYQLLVLHKKWSTGEEKYVLPKGHIEKEESLEEAAIRETTEESGYTDFKLLYYLGSVTYELDWKEIQVKTDHYFLSVLNSESRIDIRQEDYEEEVSVEIIWMDLEKAFEILTYEKQKEIHDLIRKLLRL